MKVPKELVYEGEYKIRTYEIDLSRKLTVASLIKLMQEAAVQNVIQLKLSVWDLAEQHISWVLMRKNLHIIQLPKLNEKIKIITHPAGFDRLFSYRDYKVYNEQDELIAYSSSAWLLMDTIKRRIARIPEDIREQGTFDTSDCLERPTRKLAEIESVSFQKDFVVNWHDLDFNEHLSNIRYMQWMFETIDFYVANEGQLQELQIEYKAECHWKDTVRVQTEKLDEYRYRHRLLRLSDETVIAKAQTNWTKKL